MSKFNEIGVCSSNSLNDDLIGLILFQRTVSGVSLKWYIELLGSFYRFFHDLEIVFFNHFQLLVHCDVGIDLLSTLQKNKTTHILYHIQKWSRLKRMIKDNIIPVFLLEWFLNYLVPYISKGVSTLGVIIEDGDILKA